MRQKNGDLKPRRVRDFSSILQGHLPQTSASVGTGGSAFHFTPDSQKLAMATAMTSHILFIDLGTDGQKPRVLRKFDHHRSQNLIGGRLTVIRSQGIGMQPKKGKEKRKITLQRELQTEQIDQAMEADTVVTSGAETTPALTTVSRMAISADGQWLATTDDLSRTYIFNLDSVQVSFFRLQRNHTAHGVAVVPLRSSIFPSTGPITSFRALQF